MILNSQKTVYAESIDLAAKIGKKFTPLENTTLNEKFSIYENETLPNGYPVLNCMTIGIGNTTINDTGLLKLSEHQYYHGALFEHIPFVIRELSSDLTLEQQASYRLRKVTNINGIDYVLYYAKIIENTIYKDGIYRIDNNTALDVSTLDYFDTNISTILNPVPRDVTDYTELDNVSFLAKSLKIEFALHENDMLELENVFNVLYGENKIISEIGLCTGYDVNIGTYIESIATQINYFVDVSLDNQVLLATGKPFVRAIEIGSMEPIIG